MSAILDFKIFCVERYKSEHNLEGAETFRLFNEYKVLDYLSKVYDTLHTQGEDYIVGSIDEYIEVRTPH